MMLLFPIAESSALPDWQPQSVISLLIMQALKAISLTVLRLGVCTIALTATVPIPKPAQLLDSFRPANFTLPEDSRTFRNCLRPNDALSPKNIAFIPPPGSEFYDIQLSPQRSVVRKIYVCTSKFYNYGSQLSVDPRYTCVSEAQTECLTHITVDVERLMGTEVRTYGSNQATLVMRPGRDMTWCMFSSALVVLWSFYEKYQLVSLMFDVTDLEVGYMGSGFLGASLGLGVAKVVQAESGLHPGLL
jgi:hypothetical protein